MFLDRIHGGEAETFGVEAETFGVEVETFGVEGGTCKLEGFGWVTIKGDEVHLSE